MNLTVKEDMKFIYDGLSEEERKKFKGETILITGFAGSLGYTLCHFFLEYGEKLGVKKVFGVDNYIFGMPPWLNNFENHPLFELRHMDVLDCDLNLFESVTYIFYMASLASPIYYRKHPIETMDADVIGLRRFLDFFKTRSIKGFLFYSTSEIYGDPVLTSLPTPETYWGNVNTCGPRACYDESKRFGETLCYNFNREYKMEIRIVRAFNNFGPGMRINDQRVVADFAKNIYEKEDIVIFSDGKATRTFAYIPEATIGYIKCIFYDHFEVFNIGSDKPEITIKQLAETYQKIGCDKFDYHGEIVYKEHEDIYYLTDNPNRRCPDLTKANKELGFQSNFKLEKGIERYLRYLTETNGEWL